MYFPLLAGGAHPTTSPLGTTSYIRYFGDSSMTVRLVGRRATHISLHFVLTAGSKRTAAFHFIDWMNGVILNGHFMPYLYLEEKAG